MTTSAIKFHIAQVQKAARDGEETEQSTHSRKMLRKVGIFAI